MLQLILGVYESLVNIGCRWSVQPGMHALVGATAMLGGVFRTSISLVHCDVQLLDIGIAVT